MSSLGLTPYFLKRDRKKQGITKLPLATTAIGLFIIFGFVILLIYLLSKI